MIDEEDLPEPAAPARRTALEISIDSVRYQSVEDAVMQEEARAAALQDEGVCECDPCKDSPYLTQLDAGPVHVRRAAREARRWRPVVLAALRKCPVIGFAAQVAVVDESTISRHAQADPPFGIALQAAYDAGKQLELAVAWQSGFEGVVRAKYHMGVVVGYERISSEKMKEMFLRGHFPDTFDRPTRSQISVRAGESEVPALSVEQIHAIVARSPLFLKQAKDAISE